MSNSRKFEAYFNTGLEKFMQAEKAKTMQCLNNSDNLTQEMDSFVGCYHDWNKQFNQVKREN